MAELGRSYPSKTEPPHRGEDVTSSADVSPVDSAARRRIPEPSVFPGRQVAWLRAVFASYPLPTQVMDRRRRLLLWNHAAELTYGWAEAEMLDQYPPYCGFQPEGHREEWDAWTEQVLAGGQPLEGMLTKRRRRDGTMTDVRVAIGPLTTPDGGIAGLIITEVDVTERTRFLQIAAHELRNPMASVKGIVSLIRRRLEAGRSADGLPGLMGVVEEEVDRLATILNEILEGFRVSAGQLEVRSAPVDLRGVLTAALRPFQTTEGSCRFLLRQEVGEAVWVRGDARRLEDVMRNLLSNARKYSPDGGEIRVTIGASAGMAQVSVLDHGIGIPADELAHVFEPFYRSRALAGRDPGGLGLGLYLCQDIIHRHGGRIGVESNPEGGTVVRFELPLIARRATE